MGDKQQQLLDRQQQQAILLSKKATAAMLGVSIGMVDKLVRTSRLAPVRLGRRVLFRRADVEALALTDRQRRAIGNTWGPVQ